MSGDFIEDPSWRGTSYVEQAIREGTQYNGLPPAAIDRLSKMLAAYRYVESEWTVLEGIVRAMERIHSNGSWLVPTQSEGHRKYVWQLAEQALAVPPPEVLPEVARRSVQALLGSLIDKYGADVTAVSFDAALEERKP